MSVRLTRRTILGGLLSGVAGAAVAQGPLSSLRPVARGISASHAPEVSAIPRIAPRVRASIESIIAAADREGTVGCVLADARTGEVYEQIEADQAVPQ